MWELLAYHMYLAQNASCRLCSGDNTELLAFAQTYTTVDLSAVNRLLAKTVCRACKGDVSILKCPREYRASVGLRLCCSARSATDRKCSSEDVERSAKGKPFETNIPAALAAQAIENGQTAV